MAQPGKKPKPTNLRVLQGNAGKRPLNKKEPRPKAEIPTCPRHLSTKAKAEWKRVTRRLYALGLVTQVDRAALSAYCQAWGRWVEAEEEVRKNGDIVKTRAGNVIQNPWLAVANKAQEQMVKLAAEFGMTPSSRTRVSADPVNPELDDDW